MSSNLSETSITKHTLLVNPRRPVRRGIRLPSKSSFNSNLL